MSSSILDLLGDDTTIVCSVHASSGLPDGSGQVATQIDLGAIPPPFLHIFGHVKLGAGATNGVVRVEIFRGTAAAVVGYDGAGTILPLTDTRITSEPLSADQIESYAINGSGLFVPISFFVNHPTRYITPLVFNKTGQTFSSTSGDHSLKYRTVTPQGQ